MNPQEVWRHLEEDTRISDAPGRVQRRILPTGRRNFFLALEMPSRNRMLVLRVSAGSVEGLPDVPDSRGLNVRVVRNEAGSDEAEVVLALTDSQHRDIFDLLVRDLAGAAEQTHDEREGLVRFLARLSDWQRLFRRLGPPRPDPRGPTRSVGGAVGTEGGRCAGCRNEGRRGWMARSHGDGPRLPVGGHMR